MYFGAIEEEVIVRKKLKNYNDVTRCYNNDITTLPLGEYYHAKINKILGPNEMGLSKSIACNWEYYRYTKYLSHTFVFSLRGSYWNPTFNEGIKMISKFFSTLNF